MDKIPEKGCFNWYLFMSGEFVTTLAHAIQRSDKENLARLERAFPQMVAAHRCNSWNTVPLGFDPVYNAEAPGCEFCNRHEHLLVVPVKKEDCNFCMKCGREKHESHKELGTEVGGTETPA